LIWKSIVRTTKKSLERRAKMSAKIVRLKTGEEILAEYSTENGTATLKNPAVLIPAPNGQLALMPWMMYAELENNSITLSDEYVMFVVTPRKELANEYNKSIGTGLVVPEKPSLSLTQWFKLRL
jgi:hypothetical protein